MGDQCKVDTMELEQNILNALKNDEVNILNTEIIDKKVVIQLSIKTNPEQKLEADAIKNDIKIQIKDNKEFGDVSVESMDDQNTVKTKNNDSSLELIIIVLVSCFLLIVTVVSLISCYYFHRKRKYVANKQKMVKEQQSSPSMQMNKFIKSNQENMTKQIKTNDAMTDGLKEDEFVVEGKNDDINGRHETVEGNDTLNERNNGNISDDEFIVHGEDELNDMVTAGNHASLYQECAECQQLDHGKIDAFDGQFYCNGCWELFYGATAGNDQVTKGENMDNVNIQEDEFIVEQSDSEQVMTSK